MIRYESDRPAPALGDKKAAAAKAQKDPRHGRRAEADGNSTVNDAAAGIAATTGGKQTAGPGEADATAATAARNASPGAGEPAAPPPSGPAEGELPL